MLEPGVQGLGGQEWWHPRRWGAASTLSCWPCSPRLLLSPASHRQEQLYVGTQDEPEQLDDWNRIAELQQRNRVAPPHLKTCYPLESRVSSRVPCQDPPLPTSPSFLSDLPPQFPSLPRRGPALWPSTIRQGGTQEEVLWRAGVCRGLLGWLLWLWCRV